MMRLISTNFMNVYYVNRITFKRLSFSLIRPGLRWAKPDPIVSVSKRIPGMQKTHRSCIQDFPTLLYINYSLFFFGICV